LQLIFEIVIAIDFDFAIEFSIGITFVNLIAKVINKDFRKN
jgi:hypothetical protein